jgi:hypothetical protein
VNQSNLTTFLLLGVLGLVTYKLLSRPNAPLLAGAQAATPSYSPTSTTPPAGQTGGSDAAAWAAGINAFTQVFSTVAGAIGGTTPQDN